MKKIFIISLTINNFRALKNIGLNFNNGINMITGVNGSGKTTILDAINYLMFSKTKNKISALSGDKPDLNMNLSYDDKIINIATSRGKWFINEVEQKSGSTYKESLKNILNVDLDSLWLNANPNYLVDCFFGKSKDCVKIRDVIVSAVNSNLDKQEQVDPSELVELQTKIEGVDDEIGKIKKDIKNTKNYIELIKQENPDIVDWSLNSDNVSKAEIQKKLDDVIKELKENKKTIEDVSKLQTEINRLKNDLNDSNPSTNYQKTNSDRKMSIIDIILFILTLGLYYFVWKNKNKTNDVTSFRNAINKNSNIEKEIEKKQQRVEELKKSKIYNLNLDDLSAKRNKYESMLDDNDISMQLKNKYHNNNQKLQELENDLSDMKSKKSGYEKAKYKLSEKINIKIKEFFPDFEISLFDDKMNPIVVVKQKEVELEHLNHAHKFNIIYQINDFMSFDKDINVFKLIDGAESFNNLYTKEDSQIIYAKVTDDKEIKLNGKNIH